MRESANGYVAPVHLFDRICALKSLDHCLSRTLSRDGNDRTHQAAPNSLAGEITLWHDVWITYPDKHVLLYRCVKLVPPAIWIKAVEPRVPGYSLA